MTATLQRYSGLDLPEFEGLDVAVSKLEMTDAALSGVDTFVRHTCCRAMGFTSLKEVLATTDRELDTLAELCGASVVRHQWGLFKPIPELYGGKWPPEAIDSAPSPLLPKGYLLAAEVQAIARAGYPSDKVHDQISQGINLYLAERVSACPVLTDVGVNQFVADGLISDPGQRQHYLVDIEPLITI